MYNVGLMPSSDPAVLRVILSRLPGPYNTSRYAVDDDIVIGMLIHHHQLISWMCFIAVSYSHRIPYILMYFIISEVLLFRFTFFVKSSKNKNILTTKIVELRYNMYEMHTTCMLPLLQHACHLNARVTLSIHVGYCKHACYMKQILTRETMWAGTDHVSWNTICIHMHVVDTCTYKKLCMLALPPELATERVNLIFELYT